MAVMSHGGTVGSWRAYMAYSEITDIKQDGNMMYVLASNGLYSYNTADHSLQTFDKANRLSDCDIEYIETNRQAHRLIIVYRNGNIDLMDRSFNVTNLSGYYNKSMTEDKTIYSVDINAQFAYLSTGFGVVKINMAQGEISDTYNLGFKVNYTYVDGNTIYAASETKGLWSAPMTSNLLDPANWHQTGQYVQRPAKQIDPELLAVAETLSPGGPKYNHIGFLKFKNNKLYTCNGYQSYFQPATVQVLDSNKEWQVFQDEGIAETTGTIYVDLSCVDADPTNPQRVIAAGRTGVYEFIDGQFNNWYNIDNSPLESAFDTNKTYVVINGMTFDSQGNAWCANSYAKTHALHKLKKDGTWQSYKVPQLMLLNGQALASMQDLTIDSRGLLWFVNRNYTLPALCVFQPETGAASVFSNFTNQDGVSMNVTEEASSVEEDKDHNLWVGTNMGPAVLNQQLISEPDNYYFEQVKVPRNDGTNYADYLLSGVKVTCMAIDGGGRKWMGTEANGVYLISEDNLTQVQHFLSSNSDLLSNNILAIDINHQTGEVFFATDQGLCSYMSDATETNEDMSKDNVYAYPNPVEPGYTGMITVTGLAFNSDIKIATANGTLVAEGRSTGGMFQWDGCDKKGRRVASGVYMVQAAKEDGSKGTVCKIAIVN